MLRCKRNHIRNAYQIHGHDLAVADTGKYLETLIGNLSWKHHVGTKTKAANNFLAFLRRNMTTCPQNIKTQCYMTLVKTNPRICHPSVGYTHHVFL